MKVTTILGTSRPGNYTQHALSLVEEELRMSGAEVTRFDPSGKRLAFPGDPGEFPDAQALRAVVTASVGVIIATPEYHGTYPAMLKLVIENLGFPSLLKGKPVALLGVAAGRIGAIKSLEQLRSVCAHTGALVLPAMVSVAGVNRLFDEHGRCTDASTEQAVRSVAQTLTEYIHSSVCPRLTLEAMARESA